MIIHAQRYRGGIHHLQLAIEHFDIAQLIESFSRGVLDRIGVIHAIHFGRLENHLCANFHGSQAGGGVGSEIWITGSAREDHHPSLFQVARRPPPDVGLGHLAHFDGR
jgi:hypothetical protein